jgi:hypothetical protein
MNRYEPSIPRIAGSLAAVASAAFTLAALVVLPAKYDERSAAATRSASAVRTPGAAALGPDCADLPGGWLEPHGRACLLARVRVAHPS